MKWSDKIEVTNEDNMELMSRYPDNYFELAIVDPPYCNDTKGLENSYKQTKGKKAKIGNNRIETLRGKAPTIEYWNELLRVSKNQIIWGINWYNKFLGAGRIVWDKKNSAKNFSDGEIAFQSLHNRTDIFSFAWNGMIQHDMKNKEIRIHPTQKPVALYKWLLMNYAKEGDKILDTHLGSGSIALACHELGFSLTACELDSEYYDAALKRFKQQTAQLRLAI
jgi:site-specific DNA-methyltransferase (adenine-specific)